MSSRYCPSDFLIGHLVQQEEGILWVLRLVPTPVSRSNRHRARCRGRCRNQIVHTALSLVQGILRFVIRRRQTVVLQATIVNRLCRDLQIPLGFFDSFHLGLHLCKLLDHVGQVAVYLLKSLVQDCQRVQGSLRLPGKIPNFVICLRWTFVNQFQAAFFSVEDFLVLPQVFTVDAELSCGTPTGWTETDLLSSFQNLGCLRHLCRHWHHPSPARSLDLLCSSIPCSQTVLCGRVAHSTATYPSTTTGSTSSTPTDNKRTLKN